MVKIPSYVGFPAKLVHPKLMTNMSTYSSSLHTVRSNDNFIYCELHSGFVTAQNIVVSSYINTETTMITVYWDMTPFSLVVHRWSQETCYLNFQGRIISRISKIKSFYN
jgi:hypothetical protein